MLQVTLAKEAGTLGLVVRGGHHDIPARGRPFTIVHLDPGGPAMLEVKIFTQLEKGEPTVFYWFVQGTVRPGDRLLAVNGRTLAGMKLAELQALLYQEEGDTVLTIEYDIAVQVRSVVMVMLVHHIYCVEWAARAGGDAGGDGTRAGGAAGAGARQAARHQGHHHRNHQTGAAAIKRK